MRASPEGQPVLGDIGLSWREFEENISSQHQKQKREQAIKSQARRLSGVKSVIKEPRGHRRSSALQPENHEHQLRYSQFLRVQLSSSINFERALREEGKPPPQSFSHTACHHG